MEVEAFDVGLDVHAAQATHATGAVSEDGTSRSAAV